MAQYSQILSGLFLTLAIITVVSVSDGNFSPRNNQTELALGSVQMENITLDPNGPEVQFVLFTRSAPKPYHLIIGDNDNLKKSSFDFDHPTKIIIHGFLSSVKFDVFKLPKDAYLDTGEYNVIGMDWSVLCEFEYFSAMSGARKAGRYLTMFLDWLHSVGVNLSNVHLIGHSLGAHVSGMGAAGVKSNARVGRITGLDPAGPGFNSTMVANVKLDIKDAKLVDVVHTHINILSLAQTLGHIDFYPNGGQFQPGCPNVYDIWKILDGLMCNHARAFHFFEESIRNKKAFRSLKCNSIQEAMNKGCSEVSNVYMGQPETYKLQYKQKKC